MIRGGASIAFGLCREMWEGEGIWEVLVGGDLRDVIVRAGGAWLDGVTDP